MTLDKRHPKVLDLDNIQKTILSARAKSDKCPRSTEKKSPASKSPDSKKRKRILGPNSSKSKKSESSQSELKPKKVETDQQNIPPQVDTVTEPLFDVDSQSCVEPHPTTRKLPCDTCVKSSGNSLSKSSTATKSLRPAINLELQNIIKNVQEKCDVQQKSEDTDNVSPKETLTYGSVRYKKPTKPITPSQNTALNSPAPQPITGQYTDHMTCSQPITAPGTVQFKIPAPPGFANNPYLSRYGQNQDSNYKVPFTSPEDSVLSEPPGPWGVMSGCNFPSFLNRTTETPQYNPVTEPHSSGSAAPVHLSTEDYPSAAPGYPGTEATNPVRVAADNHVKLRDVYNSSHYPDSQPSMVSDRQHPGSDTYHVANNAASRDEDVGTIYNRQAASYNIPGNHHDSDAQHPYTDNSSCPNPPTSYNDNSPQSYDNIAQSYDNSPRSSERDKISFRLSGRCKAGKERCYRSAADMEVADLFGYSEQQSEQQSENITHFEQRSYSNISHFEQQTYADITKQSDQQSNSTQSNRGSFYPPHRSSKLSLLNAPKHYPADKQTVIPTFNQLEHRTISPGRRSPRLPSPRLPSPGSGRFPASRGTVSGGGGSVIPTFNEMRQQDPNIFNHSFLSDQDKRRSSGGHVTGHVTQHTPSPNKSRYTGKPRSSNSSPVSREVRISKMLTGICRHKNTSSELIMMDGGYFYVEEILNTPPFLRLSVTSAEIRDIVQNNDKQRFSLKEEEGNLMICANQGHSIQIEGLELEPILSADNTPVVVHGTYDVAWNSIETQGLKRMGRNHIHFAPGTPGTGQVISGMRRDCQILVYIDLPKALAEGYKFYQSKNKVILCEGDETGTLPPRYFKSVRRIPGHRELLNKTTERDAAYDAAQNPFTTSPHGNQTTTTHHGNQTTTTHHGNHGNHGNQTTNRYQISQADMSDNWRSR